MFKIVSNIFKSVRREMNSLDKEYQLLKENNKDFSKEIRASIDEKTEAFNRLKQERKSLFNNFRNK